MIIDISNIPHCYDDLVVIVTKVIPQKVLLYRSYGNWKPANIEWKNFRNDNRKYINLAADSLKLHDKNTNHSNELFG